MGVKQPELDLQKLKVQIHQFILSKTRAAKYYKWGQDPAQEKKIFEEELLWIERAFDSFYVDRLNKICSQEEQEQIKAEFIERAELWHELRQSGKNFSPEKMKRLFEMESAFKRGEVPYHLKRVNKELGIIAGEESLKPEKNRSLKDYLLEVELERLKNLTESAEGEALKTKPIGKTKEVERFN